MEYRVVKEVIKASSGKEILVISKEPILSVIDRERTMEEIMHELYSAISR